jgi:hypothetical protein
MPTSPVLLASVVVIRALSIRHMPSTVRWIAGVDVVMCSQVRWLGLVEFRAPTDRLLLKVVVGEVFAVAHVGNAADFKLAARAHGVPAETSVRAVPAISPAPHTS